MNNYDHISPSDDSTELDLPETKSVVAYEEGAGRALDPQSGLDDFHFARHTLHNLIENGQTALAECLRVAMVSDSPRAYEVVSTLMKNIAEMSNSMLDMQGKMIDMQKKLNTANPMAMNKEEEDVGFYGTTEELLDKLEKAKK